MDRLKGKTALVTGASRGIGRAISERLAGEGALVAVHYGTNKAAACDTIQAIEATGGHAFAIQAEFGQLAAVDVLLGRLKRELSARAGDPGLDILVNNAGIGLNAAVGDTTEAGFDKLMAVNVKAPFFLVQRALPRIRDGGRIVNVTSAVVRIASASQPRIVYGMSKGALDVFTRTLAVQLGPREITVNSIAPGVIDTDMNAFWLRGDPVAKTLASKRSVLGRVGQPLDVADIALFLATPEGRWVTGQSLDASGGSHL
jgi:3-oxoacyl-[acyl-carrier protein] reductase